MGRRSVQIPDALWAEIKRRAERQGESASAYIREAVIARIFYEEGRAGRDVFAQALEKARESKEPPR